MGNGRKLNSTKVGFLNYGSFSTYRNAIYGMAALWIVLFHGAMLKKVVFEPKWLSDTIDMGNIGVDIFVFLSGICLYFSYSKGVRLGEFYIKRFVRVYIPYLIMVIPYLLFLAVKHEINLKMFLQISFTVNFWTGEREPLDLWYVSAILVFYLLYPLIYLFIFGRNQKLKRAKNAEKKKRSLLRMIILALISAGASVLLFYFFNDIYLVIDKATVRLTVFIIGCYVGKLVKDRKRLSPWLLLIAVLIVGGSYPLYHDELLVGVWNRYYGSLTGIALVYIWSQIFALLSYVKLDKVFAFFGAFSLEIYVMTILSRKFLIRTKWYGDQALQYYLLFAAVGIFGAWILSLIEKPLFKSLNNKGL